MRTFAPIVAIACLAAFSAAAMAQSTDIVLLDLDAGAPVDARHRDAGQPDVADVAPPPFIIEGINSELDGEPELTVPSANLRREMEKDIIAVVKWCIAARTVEVSNVDVGFMYLVRAGRPLATLTEVINDEALHLSRFHVDALRMFGETRPIDIGPEREVFLECVETVSLSVVPEATERLSFRIRRGALTLLVQDLAWAPFQ